MANLNKKKGTAAETRVVKFLQARKIKAERRALHGNTDQGDIILPEHNIILEVKTGKQTENYSRSQFEKWIEQARVEGRNTGLPCYLVIVRYNRSLGNAEVWYSNTKPNKYVKDNFYAFLHLDEFAAQLKL